MNFYDNVNWPFHILFTVFFLGAGLLFLVLDQKRRKAFAKACGEVGLVPQRRFSEPALESLQQFDLFTDVLLAADTLHVKGRFHNRRGMLLFDMNYRSVNPADFPSLVLLCIVVDLDSQPPPFTCIPASLADQLQAKPQQARYYPEEDGFNEAFQIYCDDFLFARNLLAAKPGWLTQDGPTFCETRGKQLLLARAGGLFPEELEARGEWAEAAAASFG
ncbi:hypothetical protein [Acanthopleuribacter pedis]|uniref:Uncharacterized protein n=1 Tax=Acanthopleuribacter pedis TaxID=442870 RepID=A0A8J7Q7T7_9BACT|nr:hypothetical protein [Acanthopleuribacter pedis]MBO1318954.1 hypothetical protein [Acanthopleuribacter pedis]